MTEKLESIRIENMKHCGFGVDAMKDTKVCQQCGASSPSSEVYCKECGHRLPDKTLYDTYKERHTVCPFCDTVVSRDGKFCPQCGKKVEKHINPTIIQR